MAFIAYICNLNNFDGYSDIYIYVKDKLKFSVNKPAACCCFIFVVLEKILLKERLIGDLVQVKKFLSLGSIKSLRC